MAVVDILISKTFDASVICPAEQTCVDRRRDLRRGGRRVPAHGRPRCSTDERGRPRWRRRRSTTTGEVQLDALGQSCVEPRRRWPASTSTDDDKVLLAPLPDRPRRRSPRTRSSHEKLMPVLGWCARRRSSTGSRACELVTEHGGLGHTSAVYATRRGRDRPLRARDPHRAHPRQRADRGRRAGRRLQLDDPDLLARLRHLGRLEHHRQRQLPQPAQHQDRLAPADAAAVVPGAVGHLLQRRRAREPARSSSADQVADRHRRRHEARGRRRRGAPLPRPPAPCTCSPDVEPEPTEAQIRAGVEVLERVRRRRDRRASAAARCSTPPRRCGCSTRARS